MCWNKIRIYLCAAPYMPAVASCVYCIVFFFSAYVLLLSSCAEQKNLFAHCVLCIIIFGMWMIIIKMCRKKMYIYMPIAFCEILWCDAYSFWKMSFIVIRCVFCRAIAHSTCTFRCILCVSVSCVDVCHMCICLRVQYQQPAPSVERV